MSHDRPDADDPLERDLQRVIEDLQRHLEEGWLGVSELVDQLQPEELRFVREKPEPGTKCAPQTWQRLVALVDLAERRRDREPVPRSVGSRREAPLALAAHGTVAHEVLELRLLLIEFAAADTLQLIELLEQAQDTRFQVHSVASVEDAPTVLDTESFDVAMVNLTHPAGHGTALLARAEVVSSGIPIVALINREDEPQLIHLGARDYLVKSQLEARLLARTLRTAVEHQRLIAELENTKRREHFFATRDSMTGLPNRHHFREQLDRSLVHAERQETHIAVLFVDLDDFKQVNENLGHEVGDSLLITLAERLSATTRRSDMVARIGGDEFLLLIQGSDPDYAPARTAERLIAALSAPFMVDGAEHALSASIGIATYPRDGTEPETLIRHAAAAMYQAKSDGHSSYHFYSRAVNDVATRRHAIGDRLRHALERGDLHVVYQPRVDARTGRVLGAEALLRWTDPALGIVSPEEFIPVADETGLLSPIGQWVMRTACEEQAAWRNAGHGDLLLSVNVASHQIRSASLRDAIAQAIALTGVSPGALEVELTESSLIEHSEPASRILAELAELGVGVALDDFGTGLSSLSYLKRFPIRTLKIDQSFIWDLPGEGSIVEAIISIGRTLGLAVVAEGVETPEQRDALLERGCHEMQGFLFSPPVSPQELQDLLRRGPLAGTARIPG